MAAFLGYNEILANSTYFAGSPPNVDSVTGGSADAAFPANNIFSRNMGKYWKRVSIASGATVTAQVNISTLLANLDTRIPVGLVGFLGIKAVDAANNQEMDITVRIRSHSGGYASATASPLVDHTRTHYQINYQGGAVRQVWTPYMPIAYRGATAPGWVDAGGITTPYQYNVIDFSLPTPSAGTWTLYLGRLAMMSVLYGKIERTPALEFADDSTVERAFNGDPYILRRLPRRRVNATFNSLTEAQVYGRASNEPGSSSACWSSVNMLNRTTGTSGEVCFIPEYFSEVAASGRYSSAWQMQPVFGLLESTFGATRRDTLQNGQGLWEAGLTVTESPVA